MFKKFKKYQGDLKSRIVHNRRCSGRFVVEIIGPPSSGKTLLLVGIRNKVSNDHDHDSAVENESNSLTVQAQLIEPRRTPYHPVHDKPHLATEWLVTSRGHFIYSQPGEAIWRNSEQQNDNSKGYNFKSLKRRLKKGNYLGVFVINPFRLRRFAKIALLRKIHLISLGAPNASGYKRVQIAAQLAFGVFNPTSPSGRNDAVDAILLNHYRGSPELDSEQRLKVIKNIFQDTKVDVGEGNNNLKLTGGCAPEIANHLLECLVTQCVNEHDSFISRVMSISRKLSSDDAIIVFTYRDILIEGDDGHNEMEINIEEFREAFREFGNQCEDDRIFVSLLDYGVTEDGDIYPNIQSNQVTIDKVWGRIQSHKSTWEKKWFNFLKKYRRLW